MTRNTWRAAIIVFLSVLLGGSGITAVALWQQQRNVSIPVATGFWGGLPVDVQVERMNSMLLRYRIAVTNKPGRAQDAHIPVTYRIDLKPLNHTGSVDTRDLPLVTEGTAWIDFSREPFSAPRFRLTVTPIVDGTALAPTTKTLSTNLLGGLEVG